MFAQSFRKAAHVRRFTIRMAATRGWEIRVEHDTETIKQVVYEDWHRVERAKAAFAREAGTLSDSGWIEI